MLIITLFWHFYTTGIVFVKQGTANKLILKLSKLNIKTFMEPTFNIKLQLPGKTWCSRNNNVTKVPACVGLLRVVDVDGKVGGGHGCSKANTFPEFRTSNPDLS